MHAYAFWFAAVAAVLLVTLAPTDRARIAAAIYGGALCALFAASGLYHAGAGTPLEAVAAPARPLEI